MRKSYIPAVILSSLFIFGCGGSGSGSGSDDSGAGSGGSGSGTGTGGSGIGSDLIVRQAILAQLLSVEEYIFSDWFNLLNTESIAFEARLQVGSAVKFDDGLFSDTNDRGQWLRLRDCEEGTMQVGQFEEYSSVNDVKSATVNFNDFYGISLKSQELPLSECPAGDFRTRYFHGALELAFKDHGYLMDDFTGTFGNYPNSVSPAPFFSHFSSHGVSGYSGVLAINGQIDIVETEVKMKITSPYLNHYIASRSAPSFKYERTTFTKDKEREYTNYNMTREAQKFNGSYSRKYQKQSFTLSSGVMLRDFTLRFSDVSLSEVNFGDTTVKGTISYHLTLHGLNGEPDNVGIGQIDYLGDKKEISLKVDGVTQPIFEDNVSF